MNVGAIIVSQERYQVIMFLKVGNFKHRRIFPYGGEVEGESEEAIGNFEIKLIQFWISDSVSCSN